MLSPNAITFYASTHHNMEGRGPATVASAHSASDSRTFAIVLESMAHCGYCDQAEALTVLQKHLQADVNLLCAMSFVRLGPRRRTRLMAACMTGDVARVQWLLKWASDVPALVNAEAGSESVSLDDTERTATAIGTASFHGHGAVVQLLLAVPGINPAAGNNYAIRFASRDGHAGVVQLLLADVRVDPAAVNNYAIREASHEGHASVVQLLLADVHVDPAAVSNYAIRAASANGHASVVQLLLADVRVDPAADNNWAICSASLKGRASKKGRASVVQLLLADVRVDPAALDNRAIRLAKAGNHANVVDLLSAHPRVDSAAV